MSDSIFRELFVELGEAAMAALQEAVLDARRTKLIAGIQHGPSFTQKMDLLMSGAKMRYKWLSSVFRRMPNERTCLIRFTRSCGHMQTVKLPEEIVEDITPDVAYNFFTLLDRENAKPCAGCVK